MDFAKPAPPPWSRRTREYPRQGTPPERLPALSFGAPPYPDVAPAGRPVFTPTHKSLKIMKSDPNSKSVKLHTRILLSMLAVSLLPLMLAGVIAIINQRNQASEQATKNLAQQVRLLESTVSGWADANVKLLAQNAQLAAIQSMDPAQQRPVLASMASTYNWLTFAATVNPDGKALARNDSAELVDYSDRSWFKQAMAEKGVQQEMVIGKTTKKPTLILSTAFPTSTGGTGVLMSASVTDNVTNAVSTSRIGETGYSFLLDNKGRVISHPSAELSANLSDLSAHPAYKATRNAPSAEIEFEENGKKYIAHAQTTKLGWVVVAQQEAAETFAPVRNAIIGVVAALLAVAALASLMASAIARGVSGPVLRLTEIANAISRGNTSVAIADTRREDELGQLARAIDRMRTSIILAMERIRKTSGS